MGSKATKKILLYVPDGTGVRNYVYASVFQNIDASIHLLHNFAPDIEQLIAQEVALEGSVKLPPFQERKREKFYREVSHLARLRRFAEKLDNPTLLDAYKAPSGGMLKRYFYKAVEYKAARHQSYQDILKTEEKYHNAIVENGFYKEVLQLFKKERPDVLFLTHQRAVEAPYVFAAANMLGIQTVSVIFSWDNLPKARLYLKADQYLVWSEHMKAEMELFYPEIDQQRVVVTGTPQFEFYQDRSDIQPREDFAQEYGLDASKKWVCFSGDDLRTSPYDPQYLDDMASEVGNSRFRESVQILFRRCPVDYSGRYDAVIARHQGLIVEVAPAWLEAQAWTMVMPKKADLTLLKNTVYHCEAVVNVGSTMAFDFVQYDKPTIYINYDVPQTQGWSVETIYNFQHFRSMPSKEAVLWWTQKEGLVSLLERILEGSVSLTETKKWFQHIVSPRHVASQEITKVLLE